MHLNSTDFLFSVTENLLANGVKMTDWYVRLEVGRRQNSSNCLEGEFCCAKHTSRPLTHQFQVCRSLGKHTVRPHCYSSKTLYNGPQWRVVGSGGAGGERSGAASNSRHSFQARMHSTFPGSPQQLPRRSRRLCGTTSSASSCTIRSKLGGYR